MKVDGIFSDFFTVWKWKAAHRSWVRETEDWECSKAEVLVDPLTTFERNASLNVQLEQEFTPGVFFVDPLGATAGKQKGNILLTSEDALFPMEKKEEPKLANTLIINEDERVRTTEIELPNFVPWSSRKLDILNAFSSCSSCRTSSLYSVPDLTRKELSLNGRAAQRLEQLEDSSGQKKLAEQLQKEHLRTLKHLHRNLQIAWASGKKLESVKVAVEIARLLSSSVSPESYPRQFVLVTDVLDEFGYLVYERLYAKANKERCEAGAPQLPNIFAVNDVPERTRDTTRNWFCKIGDIKELLPRFYVETALIGCIRFLDGESLSVNLMRLAEMPLLITNPLISGFARAYLCRVAMRLIPEYRAPHWKCFNDCVTTSSVQLVPSLTTALEWIIQCVAYGATTYEELKPLWDVCANPEKRPTVLLPFLHALPSTYLCMHALDVCKLIVTGEDVNCRELCVFGERLMESDIAEGSRRIILKNCWRKAARLVLIQDFIECTTVWIEFAARYFTLSEVEVMLEILIRRITSIKKCETIMDELLKIVEKIAYWTRDAKDLLRLNHFLALIDLFRGEPQRANCAIAVLSAFVRSKELASIGDFQLANQILNICQLLHDSLSALSVDDEKQLSANYIIRTLDRLELHADPERALDFYVDARAAFFNLEAVIAYLVTKVCCLGLSVVRQGSVSHAGEAFVRACVAYAYITVASLSSSATKIELYLQAGMLSLVSNSLPQTDAIVKSSIRVLAVAHDLKASVYRSICSSFLAFLVLVPDSSDKNFLHMFNAYFNAISRFPWQDKTLEHGYLLLECICYLSAMSQSELPYHIIGNNVWSNDTLYSSTKEFIETVDEKCETVMGRLENVYKQDKSRLTVLAMDIVEVILSLGNVKLLAELVLELYEDCTREVELRKRREVILKRIQYQAKINPDLKRLYEQLCALEGSAHKGKT